MDYIIFGMGTGATLVLAGWLLREFGPRLRDRAPEDDHVLSGGELVIRMAWARFCGTCGMALLLAGLLVLAATGIMTLIAPEDGLGSIVVLSTFALCVLLMLAWTWLFLRQFGTVGILRPKEKPAVATPATTTPAMASDTTAGEAAAEPAASFAEAAAARGGFGRFGNLLRRQPAKPAETAAPPAESTADAEAPAAPATEAVPEPEPATATATPVEATTTEEPAVPDELPDKRLSLDDPLVTSVQTPAQERVASDAGHLDTPPAEPAPVEGDDRQAADVAIDTLRRRRIERLKNRENTP